MTQTRDPRTGALFTDGAGHVKVVNQEIGSMASMQEYDTIAFVAATTSVQTFDISIYDEVSVTVSRDSGSTDSIEVAISMDGVNYSPVPASGRDASTGTFKALTALVSGQYTIPFNGKHLKFTKSGATDPITVTWSARNSNRGAY